MNFKISIFNNNKNEDDQRGMILTSEEIISVKYKTRIAEYRNFANTDSEIRVRIRGMILSGLNERNVTEADFTVINSLLEDYKNNSLEESNLSEMKHIYQKKLKSLNEMVFQGIEKFDLNNFYEHNKKNIISLTNWALDYKSNNEYRDVMMEINLGNEKTMDLIFENMYVENFKQSFNIENGNGEFLLELKQKYYNGSKIKIE